MAWTPLPPPLPDEDATLGQLLQELGEPATGYISAGDLQTVVNTLLSRLYYLEQRVTTLEAGP